MGLGIYTKDFVVGLSPQQEMLYRFREGELRRLEDASKEFFVQGSSLDTAVVGDTKFARPTWITLGTDQAKIRAEAEKYQDRKNHAIIGNGGSVEPAFATASALVHPSGEARLIPVTSSNPDDIGILALALKAPGINPGNTYAYAVSKSGDTLNILLQSLAYMDAGYTVVPITQNKPSALKDVITILGLHFIEHTNVGGRFTANQPNALVPVYAAAMHNGVQASIDEFVAGLNNMAQKVRPDVPIENNPAKKLALLLYRAELAGYGQIFMPIYSNRLMGVAGLAAQLFHETYGKHGSGQSLLAMEAPECQHHSNQRFFGGPKDMVGITVGVDNYGSEVIADVRKFSGINLKGIGKLGAMHKLAFSDLMKYERLGVYDTARKDGIPVMDIALDRVDGDSVGKIVALLQGVAMYSAFLRGNRWDDQPSVEGSKNKTIEMAIQRSNPAAYFTNVERV